MKHPKTFLFTCKKHFLRLDSFSVGEHKASARYFCIVCVMGGGGGGGGGGGEETRSGTEKRCSHNLQSDHPA